MDKHIVNFIEDMLSITTKKEYEFHESCGFTFVFRKDFIFINDQVSSAEIQPVGIIYEENDEFYYAPLHDEDEIEVIVQEYVKNI